VPPPKLSDLTDETTSNQGSGLIVFDDANNASSTPDEFTKKFKKLKNDDYEQDIKLRKHFSWATFSLLCVWMVIVASLLAFSGLSDGVLIALISGATVQIIGLYYIVLRYIFPSRNSD
jgi:hypothetical protein